MTQKSFMQMSNNKFGNDFNDTRIWQMINYNNTLFAFGFWIDPMNTNNMINKMWFSTDAVTWARIDFVSIGMPASLRGYQVVSFKGKLWILGGVYLNPANNSTEYNNIIWSSTDGINWTNVGLTPANLRSTAAVVFKDEIYLYGPAEPPWYINALWTSFNGTTWISTSGTNNLGRGSNYTLCVHQDKLWTVGGRVVQNNVNSGLAYSVDGLLWVNHGENFAESSKVFSDPEGIRIVSQVDVGDTPTTPWDSRLSSRLLGPLGQEGTIVTDEITLTNDATASLVGAILNNKVYIALQNQYGVNGTYWNTYELDVHEPPRYISLRTGQMALLQSQDFSDGVVDAGLIVGTNANGKVDFSMLPLSSVPNPAIEIPNYLILKQEGGKNIFTTVIPTSVSNGVSDKGKIVCLNADGKIDHSMLSGPNDPVVPSESANLAFVTFIKGELVNLKGITDRSEGKPTAYKIVCLNANGKIDPSLMP